jgi:hypothetical protein
MILYKVRGCGEVLSCLGNAWCNLLLLLAAAAAAAVTVLLVTALCLPPSSYSRLHLLLG